MTGLDDQAQATLQALEAEIAALRGSLSWRVTAPLRALASGVLAVRKGAGATHHKHAATTPASELGTNLAHFRERFEDARRKLRTHLPPNVLSGRFLDIGCGIGNGVVAASSLGASLSVGIDANLALFAHEFQIEEFPDLCRMFGANPSRCLLMQADIFQTQFPTGSFDYALMLDSAEHVPEPARFIRSAYECLAPGGCFLIETCPLYYSPAGAHLWTYFPTAEFPWVHLWTDFEQRLRSRGVDSWSEARFRELNRVTCDELIRAVKGAGFEILLERRGGPTDETRALFGAFRNRIDPRFLERPELLFEDAIAVVGIKSA